ncbi:MAG: MarR family transcriptional regulator [Oscillospiraceae bacterium]
MTNSHDYGDGVPHSMVEMHILTLICDNPGITVGQVAESWGCTKGAASQNITKLEKKGLLVRTKLLNNGREVHIYPTEEGKRLSESHKAYDHSVETSFSNKLLERCTLEELENFAKIMNVYSDIVEEEMQEFKK